MMQKIPLTTPSEGTNLQDMINLSNQMANRDKALYPSPLSPVILKETDMEGQTIIDPNDPNVGKKYDAGKPRIELLPDLALEEVAKVMNFGAKKYGDYNWAKGMDWSRLVGALKRHTGQFNRGVDFDEETGLSHMAHAACDALFLLEYHLRNLGNDNRHKW